MKKILFLVVISVLAVHSQDLIGPEFHNLTSSTPVPSTSLTTKSTSATTPKPSTSKPPSPPPSSSTAPPAPTKPSPAPTPKPSPAPTPKPSPAPTSKPSPPPRKDPEIGNWDLTDKNNTKSHCLLLRFAVQFEITYPTNDNKTLITYINVPPNANSSGVCSTNTKQNISIQWNNQTNDLTLTFNKNSSLEKYYLESIVLQLTPDEITFPEIDDPESFNLTFEKESFETSLKKSYKCDKKQTLMLDSTKNKTSATITVSHLQFEAFESEPDTKFTSIEDCEPPSPDTPDVVPIIVGCALAALVIVVLVGYLIGRRRRQARGYLSM